MASGLLPDELADEIVNRHVFLRLLGDLPEQQRTIIAWTYDGYRPTEIAGLLGMNPATVRSLLRDARTKLKRAAGPGEESL